MARPFEISGATPSGVYYAPEMTLDYSSAVFHIEFYSVTGDLVTPDGGSVVIEVSYDGATWWVPEGGAFNAVDVYRGARIAPTQNGPFSQARVTLDGVSGAVSFRAVVFRSRDDLTNPVRLTAADINIGRVPVDVGSTGFFAGQEVRFFYEFNVPSGESRWVKVVLPVACTLKLQSVSVDAGSVRYRSWRDATDVGPWVAPASPLSGLFNRNQLAADQYGYTVQTSVYIGGNGAASGGSGVVSEVARVVASGATAQQATVGMSVVDERGVSAGTYHIQIENISNGAATGVYMFNLEERSGVTDNGV